MPRTASVERNTLETQISVSLDLDGTGKFQCQTGLPFFEHMLEQVAKHGRIDLDIVADGDLAVDPHHTVEDIGITLGQGLSQALVDKKGIERFASAYVPLDEALSRVVVDISGRPGLTFNVGWVRSRIGDFDADLFHEFFQGFVNHAFLTLHIDCLRGDNAHHQAETVFKAFGRALRLAVARDSSRSDTPSTKGSL